MEAMHLIPVFSLNLILFTKAISMETPNYWNESSTAEIKSECFPKVYNLDLGDGKSYRGIQLISSDEELIRTKREPKLFSFTTDNQDVNIRMEFGVPFITVPIKRTIDGLRSFATSVMQGEIPKPHFNVHSLILIALLSWGFSALGGVMRKINEKAYLTGTAPHFFGRSDTDEDDPFETFSVWNVLEMMDKALAKYNIDGTACIQRSICLHVQESIQEVEKRRQYASQTDQIIEGVSRTDWIMQFIAGTAIEDAFEVARHNKDCDEMFSSCTVNLGFFYSGVENMMKNML